MAELKPCPFCGGKAHFRHKTQKRVHDNLTASVSDWGLDPVSLGAVHYGYMDVFVYDGRYGVQVYCGKCKVKTPYVWGKWHEYTEEEIEIYEDLPHWADDFEKRCEPELFEKAVAAWNRRASDDPSD